MFLCCIMTEPEESPMTVTACVPHREYSINMLEDHPANINSTEGITDTKVQEASQSPKTLNACCPRMRTENEAASKGMRMFLVCGEKLGLEEGLGTRNKLGIDDRITGQTQGASTPRGE